MKQSDKRKAVVPHTGQCGLEERKRKKESPGMEDVHGIGRTEGKGEGRGKESREA